MPKNIDLQPAAQYLRVSTGEHPHSIAQQQQVISEYASKHHFKILRTYEDVGVSGLTLHGRQGFAALLTDVLSGNAPFRVILVHDITRWGRFQDVDESAYLEFICKRSRIPVHYCDELCAGSNLLESTLMKAMRRLMAAEYSRELSVKCYQGLKRVAIQGFSTGGPAPYGYRRVGISARDGSRYSLKKGEWKFMAQDRVCYVLGPQREVDCVRRIFHLFLHRHLNPTRIASVLNKERIASPRGCLWSALCIYSMLRNPRYVGDAVWNRSTLSMGTSPVKRPKHEWVVKENAFPAIISRSMFERVQESMKYVLPHRSDEQLLKDLRLLLNRKGRITGSLIDADRKMASRSAYAKRFGTLRSACKQIGYKLAWR